MRALSALALSICLTTLASRAGAADAPPPQAGPFQVGLAVKAKVVDPSHGMDFEFLLRNA